MRMPLILAAGLLVAGCFATETPLYTDDAGACPIANRLTYTMPFVGEGGTVRQRDHLLIEADGRHCRIQSLSDDQPEVRALFVPLQDGWSIMQADNEEGGADYQLVRLSDGRIEFYSPNCADFDEAALNAWGIPFHVPLAPARGDALEEAAPISPRSAKKQQRASGNGTLVCSPVSTQQLETAFRAWIQLGRAPTDTGLTARR